ncbi:hypothetical protein [Pediococcus cellicola]|uniref:Bacterial archaeo-eukaryotic release factor family 6 domain-containing protein n=1 Tax=Pediococcus cellicola TaxID=319652 RepID=A0A0R2IMM7_9LACO|nr:hypothetical protein [Pediococcus cellicola]KRN66219.1 hypothetical protein IV80_GL001468 [Pediococcus cellicola]GEL15213.1 hypothetical protein PCE01_10150 [Pediococcus cellicola]
MRINRNDLYDLLSSENGPFVTMIVNNPTDLKEIQQTKITFKNLMREAKERLTKMFPKLDHESYLSKLGIYGEDNSFWLNNKGRSTALIGNMDQVESFQLSEAYSNQVSVSRQPNVLPIIQELQMKFEYLLIALNQTSFELYRGDGYDLEKVRLDEDAPRTLKEALGDNELVGGEVTFRAASSHGGDVAVAYHGHNEKSQEVTIDQINYYQMVDQYVTTNYAHPESLMTIVFALPENQAKFRQVSKNKNLSHHLKIEESPNGLGIDQLENKMRPVAHKWFEQIMDVQKQRYETAKDKNKATSDMRELVRCAVAGQIDTLFVRSDTTVVGMIDDEGKLDTESLEAQENNLVNDVVDKTMQSAGRVVLLDTEDMPTDKVAAGILRY